MAGDPRTGFVPWPTRKLPGRAGGPLSGLTFATKDLYDVAGEVTGCGNPDWLRTHAPAGETAPVVSALVEAGAEMVGKTITDEIAFSIIGANPHYGTPPNPACPDRVPGGSSSGSASVVAAGLVDFALGSDTGGSVRVPASHCGIFGIRTSHGRISLANVMPLAPSFDTVGWFARDAATLARVGEVLLGEEDASPATPRLLAARDCFSLAVSGARESLDSARRRIEAFAGAAQEVDVAGTALEKWFVAFRTLQFAEVWKSHGAWIESAKPQLGALVEARLKLASQVTADEVAGADRVRGESRARLDALLGDDGLLVLPAAPSAAPRRDASDSTFEAYRARALQLTCLAGLAGLPQISLPWAQDEGCPVAISLIAGRGRDRFLLDFVRRLPAGERSAVSAKA